MVIGTCHPIAVPVFPVFRSAKGLGGRCHMGFGWNLTYGSSVKWVKYITRAARGSYEIRF